MNNHWIKSIAALSLSGMILVGCSLTAPTNQVATKSVFIASEQNTQEIANAIEDQMMFQTNRGGFEVFKQLIAGDPEKNQLFSPVSLSMALGMVQNGAELETYQELQSYFEGFLQTGKMATDSSRVNKMNHDLKDYFEKISEEIVALEKNKDNEDPSFSKVQTTQLVTANSFWIKDQLKPQQTFVDTLKSQYDAEVFGVNFVESKTVAQMNQWVETKTKGLLKDTFSSFDEYTAGVLVNTVYYKATWLSEFAPAQPMPFYSKGAENSELVPTLNQTDTYNYYENDQFQMVGIPYEGSTMYVYLPKESLDSWLDQMDYETLNEAITLSKDSMTRVHIQMPKWKDSVKNDLTEVLKDLGIQRSFSESEAQFGKLLVNPDGNLFISQLFQNATITVDEKGTEAAAVTVITMETTTALEPTTPLEFICNKPFIYVIREENTGADLFCGIVRSVEAE